ncbi:MAG: ABC transporter substrate-binding protein [Brachymonas sp.]|jgi:putative ABC transport system substrate-binding protein|nr:ABC transporter substrate-binding protein [Brachymonas sp.]MBP6966366.1 ABC transporter substrate-binding protein [Brachymonas sp.]MBP7246156.1 ABC transporter substrate-binding protein [Brachymonas sp.]MBP7724722.1 ABC transporter substrate-binding protein [Brachymonas sp.]MBP7733917.1 ABC transporter substrate-binding protein [Brachymonas sp.]
MKPLFSRRRIISSLALGATVALLPLAQAQTAPVKSVAVTAIVDHPALDAVRKGVEDELKAQGWQAGKNLKYQYQSAQGNAATAGQIVRKFIGDKADAIVAIATPSAQAAAAATSSVPIVFSAVTDPVAAKLVKDLKAPGGNVTGVSDRLPLAPQVDLMLKVVPTAKRVGIVYSPGEINSTILIKELKAVLAQRGMTLVSAAAPRTVDVQAATKSLVGKVDLIYSSTDNNVVSAYETMVRVATDAKLPMIAADTSSIKRGAVAALGMNYYDMGRQTGKMVVRILKGEKPGSIAVEEGRTTMLELNAKAAREQGATLSAALLKEGKVIVP